MPKWIYLGPSGGDLIFGAKHSNVQKMKRPICTKTSTGRRLNVWKLSGFPEHHFATSSTSFFRVVDVVLKRNFQPNHFHLLLCERFFKLPKLRSRLLGGAMKTLDHDPGPGVYEKIWVFPKTGVPQNGWFMMEIPIKLDDLGVPPFSETPLCNTMFFPQHWMLGLVSRLRFNRMHCLRNE